MSEARVTRLAPSPTGALHLGNARTFLINWIIARQRGWKIILRIEDLDGPRVKRSADQQAIEDLQWLGIDWDDGPVYQSQRLSLYTNAVDKLLNDRVAYPCICTRKEVELAASAPHADDGAAVYPGTCRGKYTSIEEARKASGREPSIRFAMPDRVVKFHDEFKGDVSIEAKTLGDFVIAKGDGTPAYQLSVVVDDAEMGVTNIIRGDDLLDSTPRQLLLYESLGLQNLIPRYWHLPLIIGKDGRRLAKRHGDTRLSYYRQQGVTASRVIQLLARWCGIENWQNIRSSSDLITPFDWQKIPRAAIIFNSDDDQWLKSSSM